MNHRVLIALTILYAGTITGIVIGLPEAEARSVLRWIAGIGGIIATLALFACMLLSPFEKSERFTQARKSMLSGIVTIAAKVSCAGYSAFIGAAGAKLIIEGYVMWGCVALGAFAMILFFVIVAPSEV